MGLSNFATHRLNPLPGEPEAYQILTDEGDAELGTVEWQEERGLWAVQVGDGTGQIEVQFWAASEHDAIDITDRLKQKARYD